MDIRDVSGWVETEVKFPVTARDLTEHAGDPRIEAPDQRYSEPLSTILDRSGETIFHTPTELLETIRGNLSDDYIGRKYYDDRGSASLDTERATKEIARKEESF